VDGEKARFSLGAKAHKGGFGTKQLREFLSSHVGGKLELTSLRKLPEIAWRKQSGGGSKAGVNADTKSGKGASKEGASARRKPTDRRRAYEESVNAKRAEAAKKQGARSSGSGKGRGKWQGSARGGSADPGAAAGAEEQQREAELRRRREMAEEEEEYVRGMFGYAGDEDEEDEGGSDGGGEDEDDEDFLDFDDEEGEDELNEGSAGEEEDDVEAEEEEGDGLRRTAVGADGSFGAV